MSSAAPQVALVALDARAAGALEGAPGNGLGNALGGALAAIHAEAFDRPWSAEALIRLIDSPGAYGIAARTQAQTLGFIVLRCVAGEAEIITLAVRRAARRLGVARALVEAAVQTARAAGGEVMWLEVAVDNGSALALYRQASFETVGRRPRYYAKADGQATDALVMRRALNSAAA